MTDDDALSCARADCPAPARWFPVVDMRGVYNVRTNAPAHVSIAINLPMCAEHSHAATLETVVTDAGFEQLALGVARAGFTRPSRARAVLRAASIYSAEIIAFRQQLARSVEQ